MPNHLFRTAYDIKYTLGDLNTIYFFLSLAVIWAYFYSVSGY